MACDDPTGDAVLRQMQQMEIAGQLAGGLAHEFNNLLQALGGGLQLLQRRLAEGRTSEAARLIEASMTRLRATERLTRRLHAFTRVQPREPILVDVNEIVDGVIELVRPVLGRQVRVDVQLRDDVRPVCCDPGQLENALLSLCLNARDAMPGGGWLRVTTANEMLDDRDMVALGVTDDGEAMTPEALARARHPDGAREVPRSVALLRLSVLHGFAARAGGLARIERAPGAGTRATLWLPGDAGPLGAGRTRGR